jgi:acyl CoA:acetate/3-ketoacid CoA transferase alpha subunit
MMEMKILERGTQFARPKITPNDFREWNKQNKPREMIDKVMDPKTAVKKFMKDGDIISISGCSFVRIPVAILHEVVRQRIKDLYVGCGTRSIDVNFLTDNGLVSHLDPGYIIGLEVLGLPKMSRKIVEQAVTKGEITLTEWDNASMAWRHKAAAMGIPFMPVRHMMGSDGFKYSGAVKVQCPFTDEELVLVPALFTDVALIHVHESDIYGNARITSGAIVEDWGKVRGSKRVILSTEKIVDTEDIRKESDRTFVPYFYVDAVVEAPYGSHPGNMPGMYYVDIEHLIEYRKACEDTTGKALKEYYNNYVFGVDSFEEYLKKIGGKKKLKFLEDLEFLKVKPGGFS